MLEAVHMERKNDIEFLEKFRALVDRYLFLGFAPTLEPNSPHYDAHAASEWQTAQAHRDFEAMRRSINEMKPRAKKLLQEFNLTPTVYEIPPQLVGGPTLSFHMLDILTNNRTSFPLQKDEVLGIIDQAIGAAKMVPAPSIEPTSSSASYDFSKIHPRIRKECESLFSTRHYSETIRKAFTVVDVMVKEKSGLDKSGKALMSEVFRLDNPMIKLNALVEQSDRDEQEGFMFLFMGAMEGIRNPKSHDLVDQRDPVRTLEYLAIASLLARRVEEGTRNTTPKGD